MPGILSRKVKLIYHTTTLADHVWNDRAIALAGALR